MWLDLLVFFSTGAVVLFVENIDIQVALAWSLFPILIAQGLWLKGILLASVFLYDQPYTFAAVMVAYTASWIPNFGIIQRRPGCDFFTGRETSNTFTFKLSGKLLLSILLTVGSALLVYQDNGLNDVVLIVALSLATLLALCIRYTTVFGAFYVLGVAAATTAYVLKDDIKNEYYILNYISAYSFSRGTMGTLRSRRNFI